MSISRRRLRRLASVAVVGLVLAACGSDAGGGPGAAAGGGSDPAGEITVSAAASLTDAFTELGEGFEAANPNTTVTFTFDSSGTLAEQIRSGAPSDVFASADESTMAALVEEERLAGEPTVFAGNRLAIVTEPGNPEGIETLADLTEVGVVSLCGEGAPCGRFAEQVLADAGVEIPETSVTRGQNVRATLTAVTEGDAVAAIVYVTDAAAAGDRVEIVDIPDAENATAVYPIGVLAESVNPEVAEAFLAHVTSDEGLAVLEEYGFLPPR